MSGNIVVRALGILAVALFVTAAGGSASHAQNEAVRYDRLAKFRQEADVHLQDANDAVQACDRAAYDIARTWFTTNIALFDYKNYANVRRPVILSGFEYVSLLLGAPDVIDEEFIPNNSEKYIVTGWLPDYFKSNFPKWPSARCTPQNWTGVNAGVSAGGTGASGYWTTTRLVSLGIADPLVEAAKRLSAARAALTAYAGYRMSFSTNWLAGIEASTTFQNILMDPGIPGTGSIGSSAVRANDSVSVKAGQEMSLRASLGYLVTPRLLAYATGGVAWLQTDATVNCTTAGVCGTNRIAAFSQTNSQMLTGWTIGGGIETILSGNWHGRIEYTHSDFGTLSTSFGTPAALALSANIPLKTDRIMVGLTYNFGPNPMGR